MKVAQENEISVQALGWSGQRIICNSMVKVSLICMHGVGVQAADICKYGIAVAGLGKAGLHCSNSNGRISSRSKHKPEIRSEWL